MGTPEIIGFMPPPSSRLQRLAECSIAMVWSFAAAAMAFAVLTLLINGNSPAHRDDVSFWAASHLFVAHANPYEAASTLALERSVGFPKADQALIMRNPPYALPLVLPLAPFQLKGASLMWSLLLLISFLLSLRLLWIIFGRPVHWIHLIGYTFGPAMICILGGQSAIFALLGLVLFLRLHREHAFAAGMSLWLCALKPHLFIPFGVVLLMWVAATRRYRLLAGAALALATSTIIALWIDPTAFSQYSEMMHSQNLQGEFIPSIGYLLRNTAPHRQAWLQYVPSAFACVWAIYFFLGRRVTWNWLTDGSILMLVSIATSPYAWVSDYSVLIPALLTGAYCARSRIEIGLLALSSALAGIVQFAGVSMHSVIYVFGPPIWLAWYLYATRRQRREQGAQRVDPPLLLTPEMGLPSL